ncbi:hypothetical protein BDV97DRAFT_227515 [Delphinella strobiligena]|nr:hypothetical protein BDV97DRAFT_227515 [Delphinella strobiligena]
MHAWRSAVGCVRGTIMAHASVQSSIRYLAGPATSVDSTRGLKSSRTTPPSRVWTLEAQSRSPWNQWTLARALKYIVFYHHCLNGDLRRCGRAEVPILRPVALIGHYLIGQISRCVPPLIHRRALASVIAIITLAWPLCESGFDENVENTLRYMITSGSRTF